jgi:hypothetical protein
MAENGDIRIKPESGSSFTAHFGINLCYQKPQAGAEGFLNNSISQYSY